MPVIYSAGRRFTRHREPGQKMTGDKAARRLIRTAGRRLNSKIEIELLELANSARGVRVPRSRP